MATDPARYPPIGYYGLLGDLRSAALLGKHGSIDWMCLPRFDSPSVFGRLLDWDKGGYFAVRPAGEAECDRTYRTSSNAMETHWWNGHRRLRVVDFMPVLPPALKRDCPRSVRLIRLIVGVAGTVDWRATFYPRFDYGRRAATLQPLGGGFVAAHHESARLVLQYPEDAALELRDGMAVVSGRARPGKRISLILHELEQLRAPQPISYERADHWLHATDAYWFFWLTSSGYHGRFLEQVRRSALALKLMQYEPTGAFVAAPTTSLPESPGGSLNWDYRYTWLRDSAILVQALHELGFRDEAAAFMRWLDRVHRIHPSRFQIMYRVDGDPHVPETTVDELQGYRGARPVRIGNAAVDQLQLDVYGEVMRTAFIAWSARRHLPQASRATLIAIVDHVLEHWQEEDSGMWEARSRKRRYLYSQVMCWEALQCALRMDRSLRMGVRRRERARRARTQIREVILDRGYNQEVGAFTQALDHPELDATALWVLLSGLVDPKDPRAISTVEVIQRELTRDGLVYRYRPSESEFGEPEGTFLICTAWMVRALAMLGRLEEAEDVFSRLTETANDLGLFAEEYDPERDAMLGNFPQALSHLAIVRAALGLEGFLRAGAPAPAPRR